jgi:hypothetical protein
MRIAFTAPCLLALLALTASGCTGTYVIDEAGATVFPDPVGTPPLGERPRRERRASRAVDVPPGHYPPPGECRVWFPDRPPGQQPPPGSCDVRVPRGAVLVEG